MTKKSCLLHFISQKLYIIWFSFMLHLCKMLKSPAFSKFWFSGLSGGERAKKKICRDLYLRSQEPWIIWSSFVVHKCKMMIYPVCFFFLVVVVFHSLKILIFWVDSGVEGQKVAQNDKKLCLPGSISQESYIIWLSCVVHKCKMMISPGVFGFFSFFQNFDFLGCLWCKRAKNSSKWQKTLSVVPYISVTIHCMIFVYSTQV